MYRASIIYPSRSGSRFDWGYYVDHHLPLAVGTCLRHVAVHGCEAERPLDAAPAPAHRCVCVVRFGSGRAMQRFRILFADGHPDTEPVLRDEPHYTDIRPTFVCATAVRLLRERSNTPGADYRVRLCFPNHGASRFDFERFRWVTAPRLLKVVGRRARVLRSTLERGTSGLTPRSPPAYEGMWTVDVESAEQARLVGDVLRDEEEVVQALAGVNDATPEMLIGRIMELDMSRARAIAAGLREARE